MAALPATLLDDFRSIGHWQAIAPGAARLSLHEAQGPRGAALCLDYDLAGGGFVIARRALAVNLPEDYAFTLATRGAGCQHVVEFKLVDTTLANVWRERDEHFAMHADWTPWRIAARDIEYAWGARRSRRLAHCDALEVAVVGSGAGRLWLADLELQDLTYRGTPRVSASSALAEHAPDQILHGTGWRSARGGAQWLALEFDAERSFSAARIAWDPAFAPIGFALDVADVRGRWRQVHESQTAPGALSSVLLPGMRAYGLRLRMAADVAGCAVRKIKIEPWDFARTQQDGVTSLALQAPAGHYPKPLCERQSYWTVTAAPQGSGIALLNTEGLLEVDGGDFAIEPFVTVGDRFHSWADVTREARLLDDSLPLPQVCWRGTDFELEIAPCAIEAGDTTALHVSYRLRNLSARSLDFTLYLALRPYLVTPPWQIWQGRGGLAPLHRIEGDLHQAVVERRCVMLPVPADAFGAQSFSAGDLIEELRGGRLPFAHNVDDHEALASAAWKFTRHLAAGTSNVVHCVVLAPGAARVDLASLDLASARQRAATAWRERLGELRIDLPVAANDVWLTLRTAAAHILVNRDGPRLQPGPRRYTRVYLRDAIGMGTALARVGQVQPLRDVLDWYRVHQRSDGELPDCVDDQGAEWLPEFDAYGQFMHGVAEAQRLAPESAFLTRLWPHVALAVAKFEALRAQRTTDEYRAKALSARYGLLPESMSHEGYMAQPVHAYWDDFWALRGLRDAAWLATQLDQHTEAKRLTALAAEFAIDLHASLEQTMADHGIDFLPGSVELGDFDATAIAIALTVADEGADLPQPALHATFDRYLAIRDARAASSDWSNYSAYEVRIVGALLRLGRRADALRVLRGLLDDCRPPAWRQWPEQSWRDYEAPAFLGDLPHSWIGAEYIHAVLGLFAHERRADESLVLAAGIDAAWLNGDAGIAVRELPTHYGMLSYRLRRLDARSLEMHIDAGLALPPGGLQLAPPLPGALRAVRLNGVTHHAFDAAQCCCRTLPAHVIFSC